MDSGDGGGQVTLRDGEVTYSFSQEEYERLRQQQEENETKPQWVTQGPGGEFVQVQVGSDGQVHPIQIQLQGIQQLPDGQLIYTTIENPQDKLNPDDIVVSAAPEDSNITQTIKQTGIQVLDAHQLNTIIEEQENCEAVDEPMEQKPLAAHHQQPQKPPDICFKKSVFFDELSEWYSSGEHTDTVIRVKDGHKRVHSIVLGAASGLFRFMFSEIADKILDSEYTICFPEITLEELEENMLKPMYGLKPVDPPAIPDEQGQSDANETSTVTTQFQETSNNADDASREKSEESINMPSLFGQGGGNSDTKPAITSNGNEPNTSVPENLQQEQEGGHQQQPPARPVILQRPPETVHILPYGFKIDFNEGGIYEGLKKRQIENYKGGLNTSTDNELMDSRGGTMEQNAYNYLIPPHKIKQERKKNKTKHGYSYDSFMESSDEDYKPGRNRSKHGYKYDSFVEDSSDDSTDELNLQGEQGGVSDDFDDEFDENRPRKRGRPKGSKNSGGGSRNKYQKRIKSEPMICVKEEAIDKQFDEFTENFVQKTQVTRNAEIKFAQDHIGFYHCQEDKCSFKTMVRPSIHQHHKFSHQNFQGFQEALLGCTNCGESWVNQIYFRKHVDSGECKAQPPVIPYVCENCGQGWYNLTNYTRHAEARECKTNTSHTGKKPCTSEGCPLTFFSDTNRETHETRAHKPVAAGTMYRCAKCNINFVNHKDFNIHKKDLHGEKPRGGFVTYVCKVTGCEHQEPNRKAFETHVKTVHPNECWLCDLCGRNFSDQYKLDQHRENNPNGRGGKRCLPVSYTCPHCPRDFNRKRHMELHVLFKHTQERPFGCDQCGKRFKTRHCVNVHLRTHGVGGYSWCCEECGKTFNQISAYHTHLKVHSNVRDFACEDCGMTFKLKHSLKKHQLVHKPEFGHTCDFCGKKFKRSDNLINHRRRHTGEHPYKCDKCNWTGPDSSSFIHHKKKHSDAIPHSQEIKLIHAISKLPSHLLENRDPLARDSITVSHADII